MQCNWERLADGPVGGSARGRGVALDNMWRQCGQCVKAVCTVQAVLDKYTSAAAAAASLGLLAFWNFLCNRLNYIFCSSLSVHWKIVSLYNSVGPILLIPEVEHWHWDGLSNLLKQNPEHFLIALCPFKSGCTQNMRKYAYIYILGWNCTFAEKYKRCCISCGNGTSRHW